ncbi:hypothetical protein N7G274_003273 [Stereocaulon virgatum]|uniref:N-acetyltransferase domain-containing protein n=1 Tax=Stereocaulon virgatum TaxID=373712 RepID=A0ABR4AD56_9LECA
MAFSTQPESDPTPTSSTSNSTSDSPTRTPNLPVNLSTRTQLHSPTSLNASPHLPALFKLINKCFDISHNPPGHSYLPPSETARLRKPEQLAEEIGPKGFTFIILVQNADAMFNKSGPRNSKGMGEALRERVIATASAKPFILPQTPSSPSSPESIFKRQPGTHKYLEPYAHLPKWEILVMVVDPELQGRGIAGQLLDITVEEIKKRCAADSKGGESRNGIESEGGKGQVMLLLSTMQEVNEAYYMRRGWVCTEARRFGPGVLGSRDGFGVVEMGRCVGL